MELREVLCPRGCGYNPRLVSTMAQFNLEKHMKHDCVLRPDVNGKVQGGSQILLESGETRIVDPETGGAKGKKLARFDLIPPRPLETLAEMYGYGSTKYQDRNWERGYAWSLSFAAMMRHAWAFWRGEDDDPESGLPHLASVAWHAFALMEWARTHPEHDDRSVPSLPDEQAAHGPKRSFNATERRLGTDDRFPTDKD